MHKGQARCPDGTVIAYDVQGPSDAPPLLLLAGQANNRTWWRDVRPGLVGHFRTVALDYRGTGHSQADERHPKPWSTSLFADDAASVLDDLGVQRAHVYGTSMGGRVAQMFALEHADRLLRLVLACTSPGGPLAVERSQDVRERLASPDPRVRERTLLELMYTPERVATGRPSALVGDASMSPTATRRHLRASVGHDAHDRLAEIDAPVLVLHGDADRMVPATNAALIGQAIPGARVQLTPGGRHGFFEEFPAVTAEVVSFLGA